MILSATSSRKRLKKPNQLDDQLIPLIRRASKPILWLFGGIFVLQNLNIEVTALLAFSSVSGVAIALASKDTVEKIFWFYYGFCRSTISNWRLGHYRWIN